MQNTGLLVGLFLTQGVGHEIGMFFKLKMMTTSTSDIFQKPTELKLDKLSFCPSTVKGLQEWLANLSILQLGDSSRSLFQALLEISELQVSETLRFDLVQVLHPNLENVLTSLEKHFFNQGLITTDRNDHIIELALLMRSHFAKVYIDIAKRVSQQITQNKFSLFAFNQKRTYKRLEPYRVIMLYNNCPCCCTNSICSIVPLSRVSG